MPPQIITAETNCNRIKFMVASRSGAWNADMITEIELACTTDYPALANGTRLNRAEGGLWWPHTDASTASCAENFSEPEEGQQIRFGNGIFEPRWGPFKTFVGKCGVSFDKVLAMMQLCESLGHKICFTCQFKVSTNGNAYVIKGTHWRVRKTYHSPFAGTYAFFWLPRFPVESLPNASGPWI